MSGWARSRRLLSRAGNTYARWVLHLHVRDATAGYKAFRRQALIEIDAVGSSSDGYCFQVENAYRASRAGLSVIEIPITFVDRTRGTSKMTWSVATEAVWRILTWRWAELLERHARRMPAPRAISRPGGPRTTA